MDQTLYRRPLPRDAIAFSSRDGRQMFAEASGADRPTAVVDRVGLDFSEADIGNLQRLCRFAGVGPQRYAPGLGRSERWQNKNPASHITNQTQAPGGNHESQAVTIS